MRARARRLFDLSESSLEKRRLGELPGSSPRRRPGAAAAGAGEQQLKMRRENIQPGKH
jgi:hypothetical protein